MRIHVPANFSLRSVDDKDHSWLIELHNDPAVLYNMHDPRPITRERHMSWWDGVVTDPQQERLIFYSNEEKVGFAGFRFDYINKSCVLGANIHKSFRGQGLAKYMWALMLNRCFDYHMLHRVSLLTAEYNEIGKRLYTNLGFKEEGRQVQSLRRDNEFYDCISMYMLKNDWSVEHDAPAK